MPTSKTPKLNRGEREVLTAGAAAEELTHISATQTSTALEASAITALGVAALVRGNPQFALTQRRQASNLWGTVEAPYEAAQITAPILMHVGDEDEFVTKEAQRQIKEAMVGRPNVQIFTDPGCNHAFARHTGTRYNVVAASLANGRTETFLRRRLTHAWSRRRFFREFVIHHEHLARNSEGFGDDRRPWHVAVPAALSAEILFCAIRSCFRQRIPGPVKDHSLTDHPSC